MGTNKIEGYAGEVKRHGDTLMVDLWYPPYDPSEPCDHDNPRYIDINLMSVRASDGIRVHYDFKRDGFVIEQPVYERDEHGEVSMVYPERWQETAFCQSWATEALAKP